MQYRFVSFGGRITVDILLLLQSIGLVDTLSRKTLNGFEFMPSPPRGIPTVF